MSDARADILARLRKGSVSAGDAPAAWSAPSGPESSWSERAARFTAAAQAAAATVSCVPTFTGVPEAIAEYLAERGLSMSVHVSAQPAGLAAGGIGRLQCTAEPPGIDGATLVTGCFAALAEEGAIVLASGSDHAAESAFLAATHVVVVEPGQLLDSMDALWSCLRDAGSPPRMLNVIRGPSRTADLGVPARLGAHGPLRLHVILVEAGAD